MDSKTSVDGGGIDPLRDPGDTADGRDFSDGSMWRGRISQIILPIA